MPHTTLPHCPTDTSPLPPNPRLTPPHPSLNRHMRHAHQLFHPLPSLPSPQHPQRLPSLGYPNLSPACKAAKTLPVDASKLSSMGVPYLLIPFPGTDFLFRW
jgi:hypothetical protein